jgi:hypothetical protein
MPLEYKFSKVQSVERPEHIIIVVVVVVVVVVVAGATAFQRSIVRPKEYKRPGISLCPG